MSVPTYFRIHTPNLILRILATDKHKHKPK
uniref:Uncharacterized protein n=1 Tax=Rhizophora mucronata TaxID=61149 RepID=A0A2P2NXQ1_RHIMU